MARGSNAAVQAIPKPTFTKVEETDLEQLGVHDQQARSYGFNDFSPFQRPDHYIHYVEPLEIDLAQQVEYDMDEQDHEWLEAVNAERHAEQQSRITPEAFEILMDRLEKEWFELTKNIPKPDLALPSEDSTCAVCDDAEGENANAIVFCDGCNLAVHQDCYGVPYIPEGQWLCRKCTISPEKAVSCILCPNRGGAFKQTVSGDWAHLLCAIWVPETRVANDVFMEPITGVEKINKQRWKLKCSLCGKPQGACIQCSKPSCFLAFHATCARKLKLLMPMKSAQGSEPATLAAYCEKHLPKEQLAAHEAAVAELKAHGDPDASENGTTSTGRSSKKARAYAKTYKLGPPLVPHIIVDRIFEYTTRMRISKKEQFIHMLCRYWSLKREARRGAPLLKRLHLEPWSSNASGKVQTDEEKEIKLEYLKRLRNDLERVRTLAELVRKREAQKVKQAQILRDTVADVLYPHAQKLQTALDKITALDRKGTFKERVSKEEVPDYYDVVKNPMCWTMIESKVEANEYCNVKEFQDDVNLVLDNAMLYNKADSIVYKIASRMKNQVHPLLEEFKQQVARNIPEDSPQSGKVGDLEPPLSVLELLFEKEAVDDSDLPYVLDKEPLASLFSYEIGRLKPPPPKRPPKPPKPARDRKAETERRKQRELDASAGFRAPTAPRTRRQRADAEAFEAEARGESSQDRGESSSAAGEGEDAAGSRRGSKWRREKIALPGQTNVPPVVEDVDMHRSFNMFDAGWILPGNTRRGGRAPPDRQDQPPPRKRQRISRRRSTLSMSTPATENLTLHEGQDPLSEVQHKREISETVDLSDLRPAHPAVEDVEHLSAGSSLEFDGSGAEVPPDSESELESEPGREPSPALEEEQQAQENKQEATTEDPALLAQGMRSRKRRSPRPPPIIIEELDTPETRREKNIARKRRKAEEKARAEQECRARETGATKQGAGKDPEVRTAEDMKAETSVGAVNLPGVSSPSQQNATEALAGDADETFSDLTSLSEAGEEGNGAEGQSEKKTRTAPDGRIIVRAEDARKAADAVGLGPATILLKEGEVLEGGTLVWAKAETYPWWPSVVFEEDDREVPPNVLRDKPPARSGSGPLVLVRFWDQRKSWQWLPTEKIRLFSNDAKWDQMMLEGHSKTQRFKTSKMKEQCREAWKQAMAEMEASDAGGQTQTGQASTSGAGDEHS